MRTALIKSTGMYVPERVLTNRYFNELLGEDVGSWLEENLTIRQRHWCGEGESTADLCTAVGVEALQRAGLQATDLDMIIIATDTPEYVSPSTAAVVQHRLGAQHAGTFDINTACAGFVTALDVGSKYLIADTRYRYILVIGAYAMSKYLDKTDKKTVTLFADGAAGVILEAGDPRQGGFLTSRLHSEGQYHDWMGIYGGGTHLPVQRRREDRCNSPAFSRHGEDATRSDQRLPREQLALVTPQPGGFLPVTREGLGKRGPEVTGVIVVAQVDQLVNHDVVKGLGPTDDQPPVKRNRARGRAGAPTGPLVADPDLAGVKAESLALACHQRFDPRPGFAPVPATDRLDDFPPAATTDHQSASLLFCQRPAGAGWFYT